MTLTLERTENEYAYLIGKITTDNNLNFCTLEFGEGTILPAGTYSLKMAFNQAHTEKYIAIYSEIGNYETVFVKDNTFVHKCIRLRKNNSFITLGFQLVNYAMTQTDNAYYILTNLIEKELAHDRKVILIVKKSIFCD